MLRESWVWGLRLGVLRRVSVAGVGSGITWRSQTNAALLTRAMHTCRGMRTIHLHIVQGMGDKEWEREREICACACRDHG